MSIVTVLGVAAALFFAIGIRVVDCGNEASSRCSTPGLVQLLIAALGVVPALGVVVETFRRGGHPGRWLALAALVYATWAIYVWQVPHTD